MSLGMEMQLSSSQSIFKYKLSSDKEFFSKLYEARELMSCKGEPNYSIVVSTPEDYLGESDEEEKKRDPFGAKWFVESNGRRTEEEEARKKAAEEEERRREEEARKKAAEEEERRREEEARKRAAEEEERRREEEARKKAAEEEERRREEEARKKAAEEEERRREEEARKKVVEEERRKEEEEARNKTVRHTFRRESTREVIEINKDKFVMGRSEQFADYIIAVPTISRSHAIVSIQDGKCYLMDNDSLNKTFLNGKMLSSGKKYELENGDLVELYQEKFIYFKTVE